MSTVRKIRQRLPQPEHDPFFFGFRYTSYIGEDGRQDWVEVPLSEDEALHPREGDHVSNNDPHAIDCIYLRSVFHAHTAGRPGRVVLSDVLLDLNLRRVRPVSSDILYAEGVRNPDRRWTMFSIERDRVCPSLVVEVTSPATRNNDLRRKRGYYYRAGIETYVIVDELPSRDENAPRRLRLLGYQRGPRNYTRQTLSPEGRLWLEAVGLWIGVEDGYVVCYDRAGNAIPDYDELTERVATEAKARAAAEARVRELEEKLRKRGK